MRTSPTVSISALDVTDNVSFQTNVSSIAGTPTNGIDRGFVNLNFASATGTAYYPMNLMTRTSTSYLDLSAEL
jgi:hypothetical protein